MKRIDLIGKRFGKLLVVSFSFKDKHGVLHWDCICDCGLNKTVNGDGLKRSSIKSCGCLMKENNITHGCSKLGKHTVEYDTWQSMIGRCYNKKNNRFGSHGARGIKVCNRWLNSFDNFLKDMGERPSISFAREYSLDRKNNNGNYTPKNCRWATQKEQSANRRSNYRIKFKSKEMILQHWANLIGAHGANLSKRIHKNGINEAIGYYINKNKIQI